MRPSLTAADAWDAAKARHTWTWFGLTEAEAEAEARKQSRVLVVEKRDGQGQSNPASPPAGPTVRIHLHAGRVLWAQTIDGNTQRAEGAGDVALLAWLGLPEAEAKALAGTTRRTVRVVAVDDQHFMVTMDYLPHRLNLHLRKGVVVAITSG
jgi:hypothetical protein